MINWISQTGCKTYRNTWTYVWLDSSFVCFFFFFLGCFELCNVGVATAGVVFWRRAQTVCLPRCGHKEAVFFQSHSMKAEVINRVSLFFNLIIYTQYICIHFLNEFLSLTGCNEVVLRLHSASLWTPMDRIKEMKTNILSFTCVLFNVSLDNSTSRT